MHYLGQLPDLPLPHTGDPRLRTRRKALAQVVLCKGCCCGQTERGLPAVPLDWLKPIWKSEKLNKVVQLTVSGCLGPCDLPNVCCVVTPTEQAWYGRLTTPEDYAVLLAWARRCREAGSVVPLPTELDHLRFERWPGDEDTEPFTPVAQEPADIVLLTAADTEVLTWTAAAAQLPDGFPSVRALNLDRLRDRRVFDAYLDDVLQESRVVLLRLLGGLGYWREQLEQIHLLARARGLALLCLPGDAQPDPDLPRFNTVPLPIADTAWRYCVAGGAANAAALLRYLADTLLGTAFTFDPPAALPELGVYHPDHAGVLHLDSWRQRFHKEGRPTAGIVFYRAHWVTGNLAPVDALIRALEERGLNALAVFGPSLGTILDGGLLRPGEVDVLLTTTSFNATSLARRASGGDVTPRLRVGLTELNVPILQAIFCSSSENVWAANVAGLSPRDVAMNVALPEFDGRIITTAVSFKNTLAHDSTLQTEVVRYQPRADRVNHVTDLARSWARLRALPNREKRVAIILANYPSKNARVGNAVGLDTPASLHELLVALREAGYHTGDEPIPDGQRLIEEVIAGNPNDPEFAAEPDGRVPGLRLGNILVVVQPSRGYDQDPAAVYHSPDLAPPRYYREFYAWLRDGFGAHAVIHLGKHGNLEWLPGKSVALSAVCYPEAVLRDLPNIYPFIINNPGEGTQAKRRSAAVIVDHLIPPMTRADTYGELRQLENLLDEYYAVQSLDPGKGPLVLEQIGRLVEQSQLYRDLECDGPPDADKLPGLLQRIDGYLCEIKEAQIRDGLHILGRLPEGEQLVDLLLSLVRQDNGDVPGLLKALAEDMGLDYSQLAKDLAAPVGSAVRTTPTQGQNGLVRTADPTKMRTCGDVIEALNDEASRLIREGLMSGSPRSNAERGNVRGTAPRCGPGDGVTVSHGLGRGAAAETFPRGAWEREGDRTLAYLWETLWPRLQMCREEIDHILTALAGRFVPPGPSGAPTRGTADVLPTGRNFYSLDVRAVPTPTAWRVGCAAADALLKRHVERTGRYPESIALVVWGTSNMRTGGDDIAEILALLGVRPRWDEASRRVIGIEVIPLTELDRPRIDVTVRISGLFRDAFPNLVRLLNDAIQTVAHLDEPLDRNFLRAAIARDAARLSHGEGALPVDEAVRRASLRVFGSKPRAYGAGLLPLIDGRNWQSVQDLADVYLTWSSYAYTGADDDGRPERDAFQLRLRNTEVVAQNQDNREHDIFDSDDYFQFHGGMIAAVRALTGRSPDAYLGDTSRPDDVKARTLREEALRVFRSRVVNPRWIAGVMRHGYKGAVEMAATVDYLFGYDATADLLDDWMYERLANAYLFDEPVREFLRKANPWAEGAMIERLLEAAERGLWAEPDGKTLERLRDQYLESDGWLEGRMGIS